MSLLSSSISSSDPLAKGRALRLLGWVVLWLVTLDAGASILFRYPDDPRNVSPGKLALYFDYGRSMEGRIRRVTRADPKQTAPITLAGWYSPLISLTRGQGQDRPLVTVYGMSHAVRLADALDRVSKRYTVRSVGAPGATTNWSYGAFLRDGEGRKGRVVVLAYMSSNLPMITTMSAMTWNNNFPMPYTSDRFIVRDGTLRVVHPPYEKFDDFVRTFQDPAAWTAAKSIFARNDAYYDALLFAQTPFDGSVFVRMARRARTQARDRAFRNQVLTPTKFVADSEAVIVAKAIAVDFAARARQEGLIPVVYLVNNIGYGNQLSKALGPTLRQNHIPYVDSAELVDPSNPRNYLPDRHFTNANDDKLGRALDVVIQREMSPQTAAATNGRQAQTRSSADEPHLGAAEVQDVRT
jgi:hypothetical protein